MPNVLSVTGSNRRRQFSASGASCFESGNVLGGLSSTLVPAKILGHSAAVHEISLRDRSGLPRDMWPRLAYCGIQTVGVHAGALE